MQNIYLNLSGTIFETTCETLKLCPYFQSLQHFEKDILGKKETPYFIDRDPKIFRHILNLIRNPYYKFPEKYYSELEFWGYQVDDLAKDKNLNYHLFTKNEIENNFFDTKCSHFSSNQNKQCIFSQMRINPQVTIHRNVMKPSTYSLYSTQGKFFDSLPFTYNILGDVVVKEFFFLLPSYLNLTELENFEIEIKFTYINKKNESQNYLNKFNLKILQFISEKDIKKINKFYCIPLHILINHNHCFFNSLVENLSFTISSSKYKQLVTGIRYYMSFLEQLELNHVKRVNTELSFFDIFEKKFSDSNEIKLDKNIIRYIIWETKEKIEYVKLLNNFTSKEYKLIRMDFKYFERTKVKHKKLPNNFGCIYFCLQPNNFINDSGLLCVNENEYSLVFPIKTSGTIWFFTQHIFNFTPKSE